MSCRLTVVLLVLGQLCEKIEARRSVVYIKCICLLVSHGAPELEETLRNQIMLTLRAIMDLPLEHTFPFSTTHISGEMDKALRFLLKVPSRLSWCSPRVCVAHSITLHLDRCVMLAHGGHIRRKVCGRSSSTGHHKTTPISETPSICER